MCREFVLLCRRLKLFADGIVAIDGSKFKAVNNRDKTFSNHKIEVRMQQLEHSISRYLAELDRADRDPALVRPERVTRLKEKIAKIKEQMLGLGEIKQQLQDSPERQISLTDPDARSMATSRLGSAVVGYNVQAAVDAKHHLIVAHEVTNDVTDRGQLAAMAKVTKEASGHPKPIVLTDRGYYEGYAILECELCCAVPALDDAVDPEPNDGQFQRVRQHLTQPTIGRLTAVVLCGHGRLSAMPAQTWS